MIHPPPLSESLASNPADPLYFLLLTLLLFITAGPRTYVKAVRGGGVKRGDVCYGMLRAAACVDESDHHALMYVWHGQTVREDRVGEASARRP